MASLPRILLINDYLSHKQRTSNLFCNLSPSTLAAYNLIGSLRTVPRGKPLFRGGDAGDRVFVIGSGRVKLFYESRSGKVLNLKLAARGDVLGLSAVLSGTKYEISAVTIDTTTLKVITREQFLGFLNSNAEGGVRAAQCMAEDYRLAWHDACRLALSGSAVSRLAGILLDWGRAASTGKTEMRFIMAMSHTELANFAGVSRETVTRTLGKLRKDKTIAIRGVNIHILLPDTLAELAA